MCTKASQSDLLLSCLSQAAGCFPGRCGVPSWGFGESPTGWICNVSEREFLPLHSLVNCLELLEATPLLLTRKNVTESANTRWVYRSRGTAISLVKFIYFDYKPHQFKEKRWLDLRCCGRFQCSPGSEKSTAELLLPDMLATYVERGSYEMLVVIKQVLGVWNWWNYWDLQVDLSLAFLFMWHISVPWAIIRTCKSSSLFEFTENWL